ncbi:hypothetical protein ACHAWF_011533 [Thalassiosira exigua]
MVGGLVNAEWDCRHSNSRETIGQTHGSAGDDSDEVDCLVLLQSTRRLKRSVTRINAQVDEVLRRNKHSQVRSKQLLEDLRERRNLASSPEKPVELLSLDVTSEGRFASQEIEPLRKDGNSLIDSKNNGRQLDRIEEENERLEVASSELNGHHHEQPEIAGSTAAREVGNLIDLLRKEISGLGCFANNNNGNGSMGLDGDIRDVDPSPAMNRKRPARRCSQPPTLQVRGDKGGKLTKKEAAWSSLLPPPVPTITTPNGSAMRGKSPTGVEEELSSSPEGDKASSLWCYALSALTEGAGAEPTRDSSILEGRIGHESSGENNNRARPDAPGKSDAIDAQSKAGTTASGKSVDYIMRDLGDIEPNQAALCLCAQMPPLLSPASSCRDPASRVSSRNHPRELFGRGDGTDCSTSSSERSSWSPSSADLTYPRDISWEGTFRSPAGERSSLTPSDDSTRSTASFTTKKSKDPPAVVQESLVDALIGKWIFPSMGTAEKAPQSQEDKTETLAFRVVDSEEGSNVEITLDKSSSMCSSPMRSPPEATSPMFSFLLPHLQSANNGASRIEGDSLSAQAPIEPDSPRTDQCKGHDGDTICATNSSPGGYGIKDDKVSVINAVYTKDECGGRNTSYTGFDDESPMQVSASPIPMHGPQLFFCGAFSPFAKDVTETNTRNNLFNPDEEKQPSESESLACMVADADRKDSSVKLELDNDPNFSGPLEPRGAQSDNFDAVAIQYKSNTTGDGINEDFGQHFASDLKPGGAVGITEEQKALLIPPGNYAEEVEAGSSKRSLERDASFVVGSLDWLSRVHSLEEEKTVCSTIISSHGSLLALSRIEERTASYTVDESNGWSVSLAGTQKSDEVLAEMLQRHLLLSCCDVMEYLDNCVNGGEELESDDSYFDEGNEDRRKIRKQLHRGRRRHRLSDTNEEYHGGKSKRTSHRGRTRRKKG